MAKTGIEWTELTWNPTTGCDKVSSGCKFCYAEIMSRRLKAMGLEKYKNGFEFATHPIELERPYKWKKPSIIFVNSMSDLFHKQMPLEYLKKVFKVVNECSQHQFQVLTKRPDLVLKYEDELNWTSNIWIGASVESSRVTSRIDSLSKCKAEVKFLSLEPLISSLPNLNLENIDWVIVGGESGKGKIRTMKEEWVIDIKNQCQEAEVPFFFKQWGGKNKKKAGRVLQGKEYDQMPILNSNSQENLTQFQIQF